MAGQENVLRPFGAWAYSAGTNGTVVVAANKRVVGVGAFSTAGGSMTINGGDSIPIVANTAFNFNPMGNLVAPTIIFTGTNSYMVETVGVET